MAKRYAIKNLLRTAVNRIPWLEAELLLAAVLKSSRETLRAHSDKTVSASALLLFQNLTEQRQKGVAVACLIGQKEFFALNFFVNKHVLIPRPETEIMVDLVLEKMRKIQNINDLMLIDVGTGSGCIPISIMKALKHGNIQAIATDISSRAITVAKKNAKSHGVDIKFFRGNLLEPLFNKLAIKQYHHKTIITANLPYLTHYQWQSETSIQKEPKTALIGGGKDGLNLYRKLLQQLQKIIKNNKNFFLFLEIDPSQSNFISSFIYKHFPDACLIIKKDWGGNDRVIEIDFPASFG